jgi:hypothetical protein
MVPVSRKSERIKINIRVSMSDEIARCLGLGRQAGVGHSNRRP